MLSSKEYSQPTRLLFLVGYLALLLAVSWLVSGSALPPADTKGLWFYSGLAALILGDLIVTPLFVRPADTIAYVVSALALFPSIQPTPHSSREHLVWETSAGVLAALLLAAVGAIVLKDRTDGLAKRFGQAMFAITAGFGSSTLIFSGVFVLLIYLFHRHQPEEAFALSTAWMVVVVLRPLERVGAVARHISRLWKTGAKAAEEVGTIVGHASPGMLLFRDTSGSLESGDTVLAHDDAGVPCVAIVLDRVGYVDGRWSRAVVSKRAEGDVAEALFAGMAPNSIRRVPGLDASDALGMAATISRFRDRVVGVVAPGTRSDRLLVDVTTLALDIREGQLLEVSITGQRTLYQVIQGTAREDILREKNTRGYAIAEARKIGRWNVELSRFEKVNWLPAVNQPVEVAEFPAAEFTGRSVGHFPGTGYTVTIDPDQLVTHSATVLGVLGSGKSFLGLELVERVLASGCKVICLDLTDQYAQELGPHYDADTHTKLVTRLRTVGAAGRTAVHKNVEEGGSVGTFTDEVRKITKRLLARECERNLLVFDPAGFEVWRQDSKPFQGEASMATLTPAEITRIFADAVLEAAQEQGMTPSARVCLVLEEAHTLVPEWNAVATDGDRVATNGTARAILQGRKFGFGCLLVTQRTASVTKTILNQCNTIFALRAFDATGTEFLRNYFGDEYVSLLPTLEDRHAVVFGRASSCKTPVLIRMNDRDRFLSTFREEAMVEPQHDDGEPPSPVEHGVPSE